MTQTPGEIVECSLYSFRESPTTLERSLRRLGPSAKRISRRPTRYLLDIEMAYRSLVSQRSACTVAFAGHLPEDFILHLKSHGLAILGLGTDDRRAARRHRLPYLPLSLVGADLLNHAAGAEPPSDATINRWVLRVKRMLGRWRPNVLVITASYTPAIRFVCLIAKGMGIPIALYPHGYSRPAYWLEVDGGLVDYWLCWTSIEVRGYIDAGIDLTKVRKIGPLRPTIEYRSWHESATGTVCWMGTRTRPSGYVTAVHELAESCQQSGLEFFYRPHPLENFEDLGRAGLGAFIRDHRTPIETSLARADVVVGSESTALLEARIAGRLVIQLNDFAYADGVLVEDLSPEIAHVSISLSQAIALLRDREEVRRLMASDRSHERFPAPILLTQFVESLKTI